MKQTVCIHDSVVNLGSAVITGPDLHTIAIDILSVLVPTTIGPRFPATTFMRLSLVIEQTPALGSLSPMETTSAASIAFSILLILAHRSPFAPGMAFEILNLHSPETSSARPVRFGAALF